MAPDTPPGRPGTLTAEQEAKLRELWAATLKVFGVFEPVSLPANGTPKVASTPSDPSDSTAKKEKKRSRLSVFRKHKDKDGEADSPSASGATTSADSSLILPGGADDDDDKHGQAKEFKAAIASIAPHDLRDAFWSMAKHDHPDALLLRFLRARKWDPEKALIMLISTMHWRAHEMHVDDDIVRRGEAGMLEDSNSADPQRQKEGADFLAQMRMGKSFLHGTDNEGRPMCVVRVRLHRQGEQSEQSLERFTVYTIETARMMLRPPVDTATIVFDMTNFSMANMDYTPVKFMIKCFEANYPESLGAVLVHKAPWIFQGIWSIIRGWLDPVVAGKVHFTKNADELESYVPRTQIPTELGGAEDWAYEYIEPDPAENAAHADTATRDALLAARAELVTNYEAAVLAWIRAAGAAARPREAWSQDRDAIADELRRNYWALDPFIRARTLYDRLGVLASSGAVAGAAPSKAAAESGPPARSSTAGADDDVD